MDALRAAVVRLLNLDDDYRREELFEQRRADEELVKKVDEFASLVSQGRERSERLQAFVARTSRPQPFGDKRHPVDYAIDMLEFDELARSVIR